MNDLQYHPTRLKTAFSIVLLIFAFIGVMAFQEMANSADEVTARKGKATQDGKTQQTGDPVEGPKDAGFDTFSFDEIDVNMVKKTFNAPKVKGKQFKFKIFGNLDPNQAANKRIDLILSQGTVLLGGFDETDLKIVVPLKVTKINDAGQFPLKADGNLTPPPGGAGGIPPEFLWSARVENCKVDFVVKKFDAFAAPKGSPLYVADESNNAFLRIGGPDDGPHFHVDATVEVKGSSDKCCKEWEIGYIQNVNSSLMIWTFKTFGAKFTFKKFPILDVQLEKKNDEKLNAIDKEKDAKEKDAKEKKVNPVVISEDVKQCDSEVSVTFRDFPGIKKAFWQVVDENRNKENLTKVTWDAEFVLWLVARNKKTNELRYLKNVEWKAKILADVDTSKPLNTRTTVDPSSVISKVSEGDGKGARVPNVTGVSTKDGDNDDISGFAIP